MQLYKDGNLIDTKENKQSSVDMSEIIGSHGYGKYIFKVKAVEFDYSTNEPTGNETQFKESDEPDYKPFEGEKTSTVALIVSRDSSVFKNGSLTAQSLTNGYGMFGYGGSFTYIGGYVGFAGVTGAASGDYNIKNKPGVFTSNRPDLTTVKYEEFADALFKDKTIKAGILKPIERIDFIDIGNIWNALEVDNTVPFTAELNPNSDCPEKLEILNEGWIDNDTNEALADKSGNYTGTPVSARTYKHFIDIAIKGDNRFFADEISYIYGGK